MCDAAQMAISCVFFAFCIFSEPRAAHLDLHSKFTLKPRVEVGLWSTSNFWPLRIGEEKQKKRRRRW